jgi:hypothetical protein
MRGSSPSRCPASPRPAGRRRPPRSRVEGHILVAFVAYCLHVTLKALLAARAPGLTPRSALEKLAAIRMPDVRFPTADGRELVFARYAAPEPEQRLVIDALRWELPPQPPPRITASGTLEKA